MVKKPVSFRLDENLLKKFDSLDGTKTENIEAAMKLYIQRKAGGDTGKDDVNTGVHTAVNTHEYEALEAELSHKEELINSKEERIKDLQAQLGWLQMEHTKLSDKVVPALPPPKTKRSWKWWKKKI
ncbi:unnamed protein product [marine sediment metagenome]|uniref:Uncharacterized protein n=1 Tax=marine sediment metagenome TaxID=412755 RepID=X1SCZ5_9ZZZZ